MSTDRSEWIEERRKGVGGSDVASVFNLGYGCRLRLWRDKRNETPDFPRKESGPMSLGTWLEPYFRGRYEQETGRTVNIRTAVIEHPDHPEIRVHVDGTISPFSPGIAPNAGLGILEIKSVSARVYYEAKRNGLPVDYILQLQYGMLVTGATWGSFCIGNRETGDVMFWDASADLDIRQSMLDEVPIFWSTVENGPKPDMLDPEDKRCQSCEYRVSCQGAALINIGETPLERDESLRPLIAEYWDRKSLKDEAAGLFDETVDQIKLAMDARTEVAAGPAKIYYRTQVAMRQDVGRLMERYEALRELIDRDAPINFEGLFPPAASMKYPSPSRPLRIYGK